VKKGDGFICGGGGGWHESRKETGQTQNVKEKGREGIGQGVITGNVERVWVDRSGLKKRGSCISPPLASRTESSQGPTPKKHYKEKKKVKHEEKA